MAAAPTVSVLTPPGAAAIATVGVTGPGAWGLARRLFKPAGGSPLPDAPAPHRFWLGKLADGDEVVLAATADGVEVHCHGGRRVVRWVVEQFLASGAVEVSGENSRLTPAARPPHPGPLALLPFAPTLRTASILLDQHHGAFDAAVRSILAHLESAHPESAAEPLANLARVAPVGRHLVDPWKVVVAGPPNVGKSSLVNALAGYQRSVVSEVAGTTRDVVTAAVAFDGWPVELTDTAGLRDADGLEAEGVERAKRVLAAADLVVWVMDASDPHPVEPDAGTVAAVPLPTSTGWVLVMNKADRSVGWPPDQPPGAIHLSALTGEGVPGLAAEVARRLVPHPPGPGAAVPYTPALAAAVEAAHAALAAGRPAEAGAILRGTAPI